MSDKRLSALTLTETRYRGGEALAHHAHERACVVVVFEGSFSEEYPEGRRVCAAPTVLIRPAAEPHADRFGASGGRALNVELPPGREPTCLPRHSREIAGPERERLAVGLLRAFRQGAGGAVSALVSETLHAGDRDGPPSPPGSSAAHRARSIVERDFRSAWSLSRVAAEVGMHPASLARAFRRVHGESLGQCVRRLRVREACRLLLASDARPAEVALAVGFFDQAHFTRAFRALVGMAPARFVRRMRSS